MQDASTTSQSDIRGLLRFPGAEPIGQFFVGSGRSLQARVQNPKVPIDKDGTRIPPNRTYALPCSLFFACLDFLSVKN